MKGAAPPLYRRLSSRWSGRGLGSWLDYLTPLIPAKAGIQIFLTCGPWVPAFAGTSGRHVVHYFDGSQSAHAPMAAVTALVLCPIQGGMIAPKPPAGPPAAITSRWSGDSSAV